jgi:hypothetical protein
MFNMFYADSMLILYVVNVSCSGNSNRKGSTHSTDVPTPLGHASLLEESPGAISEDEMEMTVYPLVNIQKAIENGHL